MSTTRLLLAIGLGFILLACQSKKKEQVEIANNHPKETSISEADLQELEKAYFASGCFWCVEAIYESVRGVPEVISGYAGGKEENPTYEQVAYGRTTHAEAVEVYYDPEIISFKDLVIIFFGSHDPTTLNRQGPDRGAQYRSIAFYTSPEEKEIITSYITELEKNEVFDDPIVTEVQPLTTFYKAEEYHQDFERKNPNNSYVRNISIPRFKRFKEKLPEYVADHH